jgi:uncharacterized NAD(P)/FAD-binding protein YdhS
VLLTHIRHVRNIGLTAEPIIDALRPHTQRIWQEISEAEKKTFLRHLRHLWGVARHRLPLSIHDQIQTLRIKGQLQIFAGKIMAIQPAQEGFEVQFHLKNTPSTQAIHVGRIINCTGPDTDISSCSNPLLRHLTKKGLIHPDPLLLGVSATAKGEILDENHQIIPQFYTLGNNLKGILWESTAVPELRTQAKELANTLMEGS